MQSWLESLSGTFWVPGSGPCSGEIVETKTDEFPGPRALDGELSYAEGKKPVAWVSSDSAKVCKASEPRTATVTEERDGKVS